MSVESVISRITGIPLLIRARDVTEPGTEKVFATVGDGWSRQRQEQL